MKALLSLKPLFRRCEGAIKSLSRLYEGAIKALLRLYEGFFKRLFSLIRLAPLLPTHTHTLSLLHTHRH
jgi:hypothetical protein